MKTFINVKNSYFRAILDATDNARKIHFSDLWRTYHPFSSMFDSDYTLSDFRFFSYTDSILFSADCGGRFLTTKYEEEKKAAESVRGLYVPVTRKVSLTDETNPQILH